MTALGTPGEETPVGEGRTLDRAETLKALANIPLSPAACEPRLCPFFEMVVAFSRLFIVLCLKAGAYLGRPASCPEVACLFGLPRC